MKKENCLNCKHVAYVIENRKDPMYSIIYCTIRQQIYNYYEACAWYQEKSSE